MMAASLNMQMQSLKLMEDKYQKKVAIVRPLVHEDSPVEDCLSEDSLVESPVSLGKVSCENIYIHDDTESSCCSKLSSPASWSVHETAECCLTVTSPVLMIPEAMKSDPESQLYCLEYLDEMHGYWKNMESNAVFSIDSGVLSSQSIMNDCHYSILVNWMTGVQQKFKLLDDTLYVSVNLINQYFKHKDITKHEIQLVGVTSLFVATKLEETNSPLSIGDFEYIAANTYSKQQIRAQEKDILYTIHYLNLPTSLQFLRLYFKLTQASITEYYMAMYILELSLLDSSFASIKPSLMAAAALTLARSLLKESSVSEHCGESEVWSYTKKELKWVEGKFMTNLAQYHNNRHLHWIFEKYSSKLYIRVAHHPALN